MKKIIFIVSVFVYSTVFSQVNLITDPDVTTLNASSNAFLDASSYYDLVNTGENNTGKGLAFPQTDLTKFKFNFSGISPTTLPSYFDGMIVYNIGDGELGSKDVAYDKATMGKKVTVEPGFYYFSNPNGRTSFSVEDGEWVKVGGKSKGFWSLKGNANTEKATFVNEATGDYTIDKGNFIGTTDAQSLTIATNNIARLTVGKGGGLIDEPVGGKPFDFVLKVYGKARFSEGIVTQASTYPDYVFDNYFTGKSEVNPNYEFKKLNEVEAFIKENNHLPGVTKIDDLAKTESGYEIDNTQLSIQTLEKVEELYLHVIEQQKEIQALKAELAELKK